MPYVLLNEDRWPEIREAESFSDAGNAKWGKLIEECKELFFGQFLPELDEN